MTEERKIRCTTSTTSGERFGVIKAWLKLNHIQYDESKNGIAGHFWTRIDYELTGEEFTELILYLEAAEVLNEIADVII